MTHKWTGRIRIDGTFATVCGRFMKNQNSVSFLYKHGKTRVNCKTCNKLRGKPTKARK